MINLTASSVQAVLARILHLKNTSNVSTMAAVRSFQTVKKKRTLEDIDDDLTSIELKHWKQPNSQINLDEFDTNQPQKVLKVDKNTSIMLASNTYSGSHKEKENSIMLTKIGNIDPIILTCGSGKSYHFLTSSENICEVLAEQPSGSWSLPVTDETTVIQNTLSSTSTDGLLAHIIKTSPIHKHLQDQKYVEMSTSITAIINHDWAFFPPKKMLNVKC